MCVCVLLLSLLPFLPPLPWRILYRSEGRGKNEHKTQRQKQGMEERQRNIGNGLDLYIYLLEHFCWVGYNVTVEKKEKRLRDKARERKRDAGI